MTKTHLEITLSLLEADRKSLKQERDTYRDLCGELSEELHTLLMAAADGLTKEDIVSAHEMITKAEKIMGDSNG